MSVSAVASVSFDNFLRTSKLSDFFCAVGFEGHADHHSVEQAEVTEASVYS